MVSASYLQNIGLQKGDRAAIISENRHEWCSAYLAIIMAGGVAVPMDAQLGPDEIKNLLSNSGSKIVFHSQKTVTNVIEASRSIEDPFVLMNFDSPEYEELTRTEPLNSFPDITPDDIASIIYTSGTTGTPKGVMLTHNNFCSDAGALIKAKVVSHEDNVLSILPLHHTYAFMCTFLVPVFLGASIIYPASLKGPDLVSAIKDRGVSILIGVPQVLDIIRNGIMNKIKGLPGSLSFMLLKIHSFSGSVHEKLGINIGKIIFRSVHKNFGKRFRFFASGGAKLDPQIMKDLEALGFPVLEGYGLTETSPVLTFNPLSGRKPGSAGKPLPAVELKIIGPSETGEGEIAIKGPMVMKGYYKNPTATADVLKDGWFMTGDIGRIDKEGYLFITGRSKEVIVLSSGKNIYPEDAERIFLTSPLIKEVCILGEENKGITESLHALIVPDFEYAKKNGISNINDAIKWEINKLSGSMPSYMRVKGYSIRTEPLPRTPLGKLRRFMIKDALIQKPVPETGISASEAPMPEDHESRKVIEAIMDFSGEEQTINTGDNLELDLGLDSLSKIELIVSLEKIFSLKLPEDFLSDVQTVADLIAKIKDQSTAGVSAGTSERTGWSNILSRELSEEELSIISFETDKSRMLAAFLAYTGLRCIFRLLFRLEARGIENIPSGRNFIIAPNHTSYLDGFAVILSLPFSFFRNIYLLGLREFFAGFLRSRLARLAHVIPIDSSSYLNKALQVSAFVLKNKRSLSVFPEGGRSFNGEIMEFKKGVGILAVEMEVPVVPVFIEGAFEALPRNARIPRFKKIIIKFGKPLNVKEIDFSKRPEHTDKYQYFASQLREKVEDLKTTEK